MPHVVVGTAGHIDHGKSTLVQALTGIDPDRLKEEKLRGITIDLGFAHWRHGDLTVAFVDVPGHEKFVRNMLAGVGGVDAMLLVVAADEGVMPQTREHFAICRLLGITNGIVAVTKSDLADADMRALLRLEIAELVQGTPFEGAPVLDVSARTGEGLDALREALIALAAHAPARPADGPVRLPIDRVFTLRGFGTVVTGTLVSGRLGAEQELEVVPGGRRVRARGIQVHGATRPEAVAGQRVALNLSAVEVSDLTRGQVIAAPGTLPETRRIDAWIELLPDAKPLRHGARVRLHQGTAEVLARVSILTAGGEEGSHMRPGTAGPVRLRLESPAAVTRGDRFVLRSYSPLVTIGGGRVLDPTPPAGRIRTAAAHERLMLLAAPWRDAPMPAAEAEDAVLAQFIRESGPAGLTPAALVARAGIPPSAIASRIDRLERTGAVELLRGELLVGTEWRPRLADNVLEALKRHHRAEPLSEGMSREEIRERVLGAAHPVLASAVLQELESTRRVAGRDRLAIAGHRVALSEEEERAASALERACREAGLMPPDPARLAADLGLPAEVVERVAGFLVRQQVLVRIAGLYFHQQALAGLRQDVKALKAQNGDAARVDVTTFKNRYGLTRKYAIPLLEYLDRERLTRRVGDSRIVL